MEYPHERSLVIRHRKDPFALIGVNSDRDLAMVRRAVRQERIAGRSFWDGPRGTAGPIARRWNVRGWPTNYLIDARGVIRYKNIRGQALDQAIRDLVREARGR